MTWKCSKCGTANLDYLDVCGTCGSAKDGSIKDTKLFEAWKASIDEAGATRLSSMPNYSGDAVAQTNMGTHWIVVIVAIIVASIGLLSLSGFTSGLGWLVLAIFLALIAQVVQADLHHKSQKQE